MKAYFTGKVMEESWEFGYRISWNKEGEWYLNERYEGMSYSAGHAMRNAKEYNRIVSRDVFHEDDISVKFKEGIRLEINDEIVRIESVIHHLDGSITYHTNKILKNTVVKSREQAEKEIEEYWDKRDEERLNSPETKFLHKQLNKKWYEFWK
jgi:hypothetical protein